MAKDSPTPEPAAPAAVAPPSTSAPSISLMRHLNAWGLSVFPSIGLATLVAALHSRPLQPFPLLFSPALLFAGYVNIAGYAIDAAGMTAAWSGIYVLLALRGRRRIKLQGKGGLGPLSSWTPYRQRTSSRRLHTPARRAVGSLAIGVGTANCIASSVTYLTGDRAAEAAERQEQNRWGTG